MTWITALGLRPAHAAALAALPHRTLPPHSVMFRPGDTAPGYLILLRGMIEVFLTGPSGREIMLYTVEPGQSCIQTTLGLMADEVYSGEAITASEAEVVVIPHGLFTRLIDEEPAFRQFVMHAFARRMSDVTRLLERVAFGRIEVRLAAALLELAQGGEVQATQAELATRIGTAREVVSRRLETFHKSGWVVTERGTVRLTNPAALRQLAASLD
ncbi:MAG: Crp/Fnr family transcriptional regulator [Paracoccaceae bacterium]